ncbi:MAG TPA: hypothetical protein VFU94_07205, partial [Conexibacter sp.]|nr:hypothetical protein [Conexibacter sp.]
AWSVGEHGPHAVPLLSGARIAGAAAALSEAERGAVLDEVGGWYDRWQRLGTGRTTQWASGWGAAALVRALLEGDRRPWPVSLPLRGEYGVEGVCLSVPALLGPDGPPRPLALAPDAAELAAIAAAAAEIGGLTCASC